MVVFHVSRVSSVNFTTSLPGFPSIFVSSLLASRHFLRGYPEVRSCNHACELLFSLLRNPPRNLFPASLKYDRNRARTPFRIAYSFVRHSVINPRTIDTCCDFRCDDRFSTTTFSGKNQRTNIHVREITIGYTNE